MAIYFSKPQNAGEAIRRVAKAAGGGKPVQFASFQEKLGNGAKCAVRRYSNGVDMQSVNGSLYVSGPKQLMAKCKINPNGGFPWIAKFMDGKVKVKSTMRDIYYRIIDRKWYKATKQSIREMSENLAKTNNQGLYRFNLNRLLKLLK